LTTSKARQARGEQHRRAVTAAAAAFALSGCEGAQSSFAAAGTGAETILVLFWWMLAGAVVVWILVMALALYATRGRPRRHDRRTADLLIIGGGIVLPTAVLTVLLLFGLPVMPELQTPRATAAEPLRVAVSGERWWWRVRYLAAEGEAVELANEVRLPVGRPVEFVLTSPDVIHSFWIPALGGKLDMIPGRTTRLLLEPTKTGTFRGACAEYCGASHALMNFAAVVMEPAAFADWLAGQAAPAAAPASERAAAGREYFLADGCGACHTVRGTPADGTMGPDLTHVGGRLTIGAGILPNTVENFRRWIAETHAIKPDVNMPAFAMLPPGHLYALAVYLEGLE